MAARVTTTWNDKPFRTALKRHVARQLDIAGGNLEADIIRNFKFGSPPPSQPGEIPHVLTGTLKRSVSHQVIDGRRCIVGSELKPEGGQTHSYPYYLEFGTKPMRGKRPWLRPALTRNKDMIRKTLSAPLREVQ